LQRLEDPTPAAPAGEDAARTTIPSRLRWAAGAARLTLSEPGDGLDRALGRARRLITGATVPPWRGEVDPDWERHLHEHLGQPWPCEPAVEFDALWTRVRGTLESKGLTMGRGTYGGWDDGDQGLARTVWCLTRHLRASSVVETGVARGITSRVILEALDRNGSGHLSSIDLPALDTAFHSEIGAAVPAELRASWTYLNGTSRRRLPTLLAELGEIELFVHDSSHTTRNLRFEMEHAWKALRRGAIVADDIERNGAFCAFTQARSGVTSLVAPADDSGALFGIVLKGL
jgi:hypothetical protein